MQAHHVAGLDRHVVGFQYAHQLVVTHGGAGAADVGFQIDHHGASLHTVFGQVIDTERAGAGAGKAGPVRKRMRIFVSRQDIDAGPKTVVEHRFGRAVAIGVEAAAHVRQAVPLRGVLGVHQQHVVAHHIGKQRIFRCV